MDLQGSGKDNEGRIVSSQGKDKPALIKPSSAADAPPVNPKSSPAATGIDMHAIDLWVKLLHGDFEKWGKSWKDTKPQALTFRWQTKLNGNYDATWEIASSPQFTQVISSKNIGKAPKPGQYGFFTIDFDKLARRGAKLPLTYYVRLKLQPRLQPGQSTQNGKPRHSYPISVLIIEPGEVTQFQLPTITDVGPFSSCRPGGVIMLKGYDFGNEPGTLRLIGNFPDDDLYLYGLDWTSETVGGTIPKITGVIDQPVSIQLVTKNGAESNFIPCDFVATRGIQTLPFPEGFKSKWCEYGDNYDVGYKTFGPDTQTDSRGYKHDIMANGDIWFGCWHSNNSQGGTNIGTDRFSSVQLKNNWVFIDMKTGSHSSYVNHDPGKILAFKGWKTNSAQVDLQIEWEVPEGQHFEYTIYLYLEGPKGVSFIE